MLKKYIMLYKYYFFILRQKIIAKNMRGRSQKKILDFSKNNFLNFPQIFSEISPRVFSNYFLSFCDRNKYTNYNLWIKKYLLYYDTYILLFNINSVYYF